MLRTFFSRERLINPVAIVLYLSLFKLLLHILTNGQFGYHRDELYYIACGQHLDFGYVDHPPLIALLARFWTWIFGDSLFSIRFLPAVAGAAIVYLTGLMAREFGGRMFALIIACLSVIIAPVILSTNNLFTTNVFDQLFWVIGIYLMIKVLKYDRPKYWLGVGLIIGLGLLNKHSVAFLIIGLAAGLILTSHRKYFRNKYLWIGAGFAFLILAPNLIWQIRYGWPTLEFLREAEINRVIGGTIPGFFKQIIFSYHPLTLPLWAAGIYFLLFSKEGKSYRSLGILFITLIVIFAAQKSKDYYLAPTFPLLWAAGAVLLERLLRKRKLKIVGPAIVGILFFGGAALAPLSIPILPFDKTAHYCEYMRGGLHPVYSDMLGWENMVKTVAGVYNSLPEDERKRCAIMTQNYGQAAAIDFFGPQYNLPEAVSPHNSYWLWGPKDYTGKVMITTGISPDGLSQGFGYYRIADVVVNDYAMPYETNQPVIIWKKPVMPLKAMWPFIKVYY
ncbi:MAG: glycosyltransferase family 39 protein [Candidatus Zixiibacteriota bacterium]|nr:MAG: glycosyltransferase family 39 protein [candidate division Zixibacteria bacterium]